MMEATIQDIFENLLMALGVQFNHTEISVGQDIDGHEIYYCNVAAKDSSQLIGRRGRTLQALQHMLKVIVYKRLDKQIGLMVDVDGYRKRQENSVIEIATRYIDKARQSGENQSLPAMSPYFRRLVHLHLTKDEFSDLSTASEGFGNYRHIVILNQPKNA
jgi:spoIIIJ-associated protein